MVSIGPTVQLNQQTGPPFTHAFLLHGLNSIPLLLRPQYFFDRAAFSPRMSSSFSATSRLSWLLSTSNAFGRLASETFIPLYLDFQR